MTPRDKAKLDGVDWGANNYTLPPAETDKFGGVKLGKIGNITISEADKVYPVQVNVNGQMGVSVPWEDTNTHYLASIIAGKQDSQVNASSNNDETYIHILDKSGTSIKAQSGVKITGDGLVKVSSNNQGDIKINADSPLPGYGDTSSAKVGQVLKLGQGANGSLGLEWGNVLPALTGEDRKILAVKTGGTETEWVDKPSYAELHTGDGSNFNDEDTGYLVYGPGSENANVNYVLAGNGSWVRGLPPYDSTNDRNKMLIIDDDGNLKWAPLT